MNNETEQNSQVVKQNLQLKAAKMLHRPGKMQIQGAAC